MRSAQVNIRLSPEESARFDAVAAHHGISAQAMIRMLVKRESDALGSEPSTSPTAERTPYDDRALELGA
jgi:hypothetical protein